MAFREAIKPFLGYVTEFIKPMVLQPNAGFLEMPQSLAQQVSLVRSCTLTEDPDRPAEVTQSGAVLA